MRFGKLIVDCRSKSGTFYRFLLTQTESLGRLQRNRGFDSVRSLPPWAGDQELEAVLEGLAVDFAAAAATQQLQVSLFGELPRGAKNGKL